MTTKLWGQQNYKDAKRDTWKMEVYRFLKTVVQLLFKLRWPQKNNGISSSEHSSTSGATTPGINTWWTTSSFLISPLSQVATYSISSRLLLFPYLIHPPLPIPACSLLSYLGSSEVLLEDQLGCLNTRSPSGGRVTMLFCCMGKGLSWSKEVDTERWCSGSEGKCSHALTEHEQNPEF